MIFLIGCNAALSFTVVGILGIVDSVLGVIGVAFLNVFVVLRSSYDQVIVLM